VVVWKLLPVAVNLKVVAVVASNRCSGDGTSFAEVVQEMVVFWFALGGCHG